MKYFIYSLLFLSLVLLIFNIIQLDFSNIFSDESSNALIGILSSLCVMILMLILMISRKIQEKANQEKI